MRIFRNLNPYVVLFYFAAVLLYSMVFMHPLFVGANVVLSFIACMVTAPPETLSSLKYTLSFALVIAFLNPLFSTEGSTVLFVFFGRNYTLQALLYGFIMAGILTGCINWFSCMGHILTTDKFMYIMAGKMPRLTTVLTMAVSLIPFFQKKLAEISAVQKTVLNNGNGRVSAFRAMNAASGYAFEHAVNMSVSMKNRGYGTGRPTRYKRYGFSYRDLMFILLTGILAVSVAILAFNTATNLQIIPETVLLPFDTKRTAGFIFYITLLLMPVITGITEELQWLYLKSRI